MRKPTPVTTSSITAVSWSTCAVKRPNRALINVPSSGNSGISQTSCDMSSGANPQHSKRNGVGVSRLRRAGAVAQPRLHEVEIHERNQVEQQQVTGEQPH